MTRHAAALALFAVLTAACQETALGPLPGAPVAGPPIVSPIVMARTTVLPNEDAQFTNSGCFDDDSYARHWTFSDGATADGASVTHRFTDVGTYGVTLTTSAGGVVHTHTAAVIVAASVPADSTPQQVRR